jgi:hypothetical protein
MSQKFKLTLDEMRESDPSQINEVPASFEAPSQIRNLCFVLLEGKMKFLNYAYLVSGEYDANESIITLSFTSEKILVKGSNLEPLFIELIDHKPKKISCNDPRYEELSELNMPFISEIILNCI